jgi:hypothetical protein
VRYRGGQQAEGARRQGEISANLASEIGRTLASLGTSLREIRQEEARRPAQEEALAAAREERTARSEARERAAADRARATSVSDAVRMVPPTEDGRMNTARIADEVRRIDPAAAIQWYDRASTEERQQLARGHELAQYTARDIGAIRTLAPPLRERAYQAKADEWVSTGRVKSRSQLPEHWEEGWATQRFNEALSVNDFVQMAGQAAAAEIKRREPIRLGSGDQLLNPDGTVLATNPREETSIDAAILAADHAGNRTEVDRLMALKARSSAAGRDPRDPVSDTRLQSASVVGPDGKAVMANYNSRTGQYTDQTGAVIPNARPATTREQASTGVQKRALNFLNRAKQADEDLEALEPEIQRMGLGAQVVQEYAPNFLQSQTGQSYQQAQRAFTEARLRKDSGAAIPDHEYANDRRTYFAQPGDSAATLEQKRRGRAGILASLALESGTALTEMYGDEAPALLQTFKVRSERPVTTGRPMNVDTESLPRAPTARPAAAAATATPPPTIGSTVTYQGVRYRVVGIERGEAVLERVP